MSVLQGGFASGLFDGESWINTLQYGIVLAGGDTAGDGEQPGEGEDAGTARDDSSAGVGDDSAAEGDAGDDSTGGAAGDDSVAGAAAVAAPPAKPVRNWEADRIKTLTARLRKYEQPGGAPVVVTPTVEAARDQAELDRLVEERASARAATAEFDRRCIAVVEEGQAEFPEFDSRINNLKRIADFADPVEAAQYNQFLLAALESGAPARVLHELGADLNEASRILQLSPIRMGVELARLADRLVQVPAASAAPKPPRVPAGGGGAGTEASHTAIDPRDPARADRLSTAEWMKRRNAQAEGTGARR